MNDNFANNEYKGELAFVLHAHLPYVRKNEINSLEEDWLFQAILECYVPLLKVIEEESQNKENNAKLTISLSPTLITLLTNSKLQKKFPEWINTRINFLSELPVKEAKASEFLRKNIERHLSYWEECDGDIVKKFRDLYLAEYIDILTCAATHGYLPILRENPTTVVGQIKTAIQCHKDIFGFRPKGVWLPECAYYENLDDILLDCGIRYAILDGHGILNSKPRPRYGIYSPICSTKGVAFFGRDSQSTMPVWSATEGFPGDPCYREFHKDLGWELSIDKLKEKGILSQRPLGLKFHKITSSTIPLGEKHIYSEIDAKTKAQEHADIYLTERLEQLKNLSLSTSFKPLLVAPFDAELFGHWWYEGPEFIRNIFRKASKYSIKLSHLKEILDKKPSLQICDPSPSSWGQGGYHNYWLNDANSWIVPEITKAGFVFSDIVSNPKKINSIRKRVLQQAGRELLLSQSSDWSFILKAGTTTKLAKDRIKRHLTRFWKLIRMYEEEKILDINFLEDIEEEDQIFPEINILDWGKSKN